MIRNSQDTTKNIRGQELLDVCKVNDLLILNGRKNGDLFGVCTSHQWNGSSVVDYFLSPNRFLHKIPKFSVGKYIPWLSDHCILKTTILINDLKTAKKPEEEVLISAKPGFIWDEEAKERFSNGIKSDVVLTKLQTLEKNNNQTSEDIASKLN